MKPTTSEYIFFMLNKNGTHNFTETYDKHLENIRAFRAYQKERKQKKKKKKRENNSYKPLSKKIDHKANV